MTKSDFSRLCAENFAANGIEQFATDEILSKHNLPPVDPDLLADDSEIEKELSK